MEVVKTSRESGGQRARRGRQGRSPSKTSSAAKTFTLADISWMPYVQYLFAAEQGDLITSRAGTKAWWERVSTRPSWKKVAG